MAVNPTMSENANGCFAMMVVGENNEGTMRLSLYNPPGMNFCAMKQWLSTEALNLFVNESNVEALYREDRISQESFYDFHFSRHHLLLAEHSLTTGP